MNETILSMQHIVKRFPGVLANDDVSIDVREGEILALLGENGAGKTTLMNMLYGLYTMDNGEIYFQNKRVDISSPRDAINLGIGMVHQHFMLVEHLTVAENMVLGAEPRHHGCLDYKRAEAIVMECSKKYGLSIQAKSLVADISVGEQQRLEILKALYRGAKILILDEPTAVLTPQKVKELYKVLRELKAKGHSIIIITHKLQEIKEISDRVVVMRAGRVVGIKETVDVTKQQLAEMMVGRPVVLQIEKEIQDPGEVIFEIKDLHVKDYRGLPALKGVNLSVRRAEIVGLAGIDGNGQSELLQVLAGLIQRDKGSIRVSGSEFPKKFSQKAMSQHSVAHVSEDRQKWGLILDYSIEENLLLGLEGEPEYQKGPFLNKQVISDRAKKIIKDFDIRTPSTETLGRTLSGGNQQKVILGREISKNPDVLIAAQPTRGLDVGAIEFVYKQILEQRKNGKAILLVSFELEEIFTLSDRILVIFEGEIIAEFTRESATLEEVGLCMGGVRRSLHD
ncbi:MULTISPECIES: ABC transporter ATP-binding protein [unclassified Oceanispirochaeta]|uniref:ABC transporter ATP-binding protein n=1 Tax=unclassified Oceanispirochaeta TaxID=2635722 RepID=UPI000E08F43A|nr:MULTISPECIES: ABC transporter ATP-binding protein [unclassified Oceanispirochaeta]MBF9015138.1 ABC transporter ATP-binding protein [Oceanispirochaeta sp. M2]NPD71596.1 ABC transporter ATP-binding protein [Oceanispirochaeta sp. M1]RDG33163.1 ABC transporter ATP-binding protein [Oceanispirochaeta sp. M1]